MFMISIWRPSLRFLNVLVVAFVPLMMSDNLFHLFWNYLLCAVLLVEFILFAFLMILLDFGSI